MKTVSIKLEDLYKTYKGCEYKTAFHFGEGAQTAPATPAQDLDEDVVELTPEELSAIRICLRNDRAEQDLGDCMGLSFGEANILLNGIYDKLKS